MVKRIKKTQLKPAIRYFMEHTDLELAGSYEAMYEEIDLPVKASETEIATLYKYRPLGNHEIRQDGTTATEDVINILKECTLYAATPEELNDPFEITLPPGTADPVQFSRFMNGIAEELRFVSPAVVREASRQGLSKENLDIVQRAILKFLQDDFRTVRILSLTSENNDPMMWRRYAAGHRGVCLGFRVAEGNIFGEALEVQYKKPPIYYSLGEARIGRMQEEATLTKAEYWSYEREWRVIVSNHVNPAATMRHLPFEKKWIAELVFGSHADRTAKATIASATRQIPNIRIGYAGEVSGNGALSIEWDNAEM